MSDDLSVEQSTMGSMVTACGLLSPSKETPASSLCLSPFVAYDDGFEWPTLYEELDEMLEACLLVYCLGELRRLARDEKNKIKFNEKILGLPLTAREVAEAVHANEQVLLDSKEFYKSILETVVERNMGEDKSEEPVTGPLLSPSSWVAFGDELKEEVVFGIYVNHDRKRVTVAFRGSGKGADWATDYEVFMKEVSNPLARHSSQSASVMVHNVFHDYLLAPNSRGVKGPSGEVMSEYQEILQKHVLPVIKANRGYKLYVTGHSLGAALCTLFSFLAAAEPDSKIPKPVTCVSLGAPYVGDASFRAAHQLLESLGKLRHARVSNTKDIVTTVPKISFRWSFLDSQSNVGTLFKHVGMNVRLNEDKNGLDFIYPRVRSGYFTSALEELRRGWGQSLIMNLTWNPSDLWTWPQHSCREYSRRIDDGKVILETVHLDDLYARKDIVGNLLAEF